MSPRRQKEFTTGLCTFSAPDDAEFDLVFIHGLTGGRKKTWTAKGSTTPWPEALLPSKLEKARILSYGYDAYVADWEGVVSGNRVANHARNMLNALAQHRHFDKTNDRPIIFIAHSLGGLVCMDALLASKNSAEGHLQAIIECSFAIAFLGVPHQGAALARWGERLATSIGVIKQTNPDIVRVLRQDSEVLARIQSEFHMMLRARTKNGLPSINITCFFEELALVGIGEIVPKHSAILPAYNAIGIHADHKGMTKFVSEDDPGFQSLLGEIRIWSSDIVSAQSYQNPLVSTQDPFWGNLIESGFEKKPSDVFKRLANSLFSYLDEQVAPRRTDHMEPVKVAYWNNTWSGTPTPLSADDTDAYNRIHCDVWRIPMRVVTARPNDPQGGKQIGIVDRNSFMLSLLSCIRSDPDEAYKALSSSISLFSLVDPLTNKRFPLLPRSAMPSVADPQALERYAAVKERFRQRSNQMIEEARAFYAIQRLGREACQGIF